MTHKYEPRDDAQWVAELQAHAQLEAETHHAQTPERRRAEGAARQYSRRAFRPFDYRSSAASADVE